MSQSVTFVVSHWHYCHLGVNGSSDGKRVGLPLGPLLLSQAIASPLDESDSNTVVREDLLGGILLLRLVNHCLKGVP